MESTARKLEHNYTFADYDSWDDGLRWEIINGIAVNMSPSPAPKHQEIILKMSYQIETFLKQTQNQCKVYLAPFDVRLPEANETADQASNVVQPDISIICDKTKIDEKGCVGAPDLIVEVLSPSTAAKDLREKFFLYERFGVREYWVVYPTEKIVSVFTLNDKGEYGKPMTFAPEDKIAVSFVEGMEIDLGFLKEID